MERAEYCQAFDAVREDFERTAQQFGLEFEAEESSPRERRRELAKRLNAAGEGAEAAGAAGSPCSLHCENGDASLWRGWISPACLACRKGESTSTFFVSLKCTRHCYFCFNPNQENYAYFRTHARDIAAELREAHAHGARFDCLAITGGEPCLHKAEVLEFLACAKELYPGVHVRIYTSGDLLDDAFLESLAEAGLDELRFSVKPQETDGEQAALFDRIRASVAAIPDVMVEMPVIPGAGEEMRALLVRLDELGVRGINLLEFCFPLHNEEEFRRRGFLLRARPYKVLYNYWYAGGLPIAGSEAECLALLEFAQREGLSMGVHYCSLDNKHTGQVFQQNKGFLFDDEFVRSHGWLSLDGRDYFLKCAKAFGADAKRVRDWLMGEEGQRAAHAAESVGNACGRKPESASRIDGAYGRVAAIERECDRLMRRRGDFLRELPGACRVSFDAEVPFVAFPLAWAHAVQEEFPQVELASCWHVVEFVEQEGPAIREVSAQEIEPRLCADAARGDE